MAGGCPGRNDVSRQDYSVEESVELERICSTASAASPSSSPKVCTSRVVPTQRKARARSGCCVRPCSRLRREDFAQAGSGDIEKNDGREDAGEDGGKFVPLVKLLVSIQPGADTAGTNVADDRG